MTTKKNILWKRRAFFVRRNSFVTSFSLSLVDFFKVQPHADIEKKRKTVNVSHIILLDFVTVNGAERSYIDFIVQKTDLKRFVFEIFRCFAVRFESKCVRFRLISNRFPRSRRPEILLNSTKYSNSNTNDYDGPQTNTYQKYIKKILEEEDEKAFRNISQFQIFEWRKRKKKKHNFLIWLFDQSLAFCLGWRCYLWLACALCVCPTHKPKRTRRKRNKTYNIWYEKFENSARIHTIENNYIPKDDHTYVDLT